MRIRPALPQRGAVTVDKLAWTRRVYLIVLPALLLVCGLLAIIGAPRWAWVILAVGGGAWLCGFVQVNFEIWRARRRKSERSR